MSLGEANADLRKARAQLSGDDGYPNQANTSEVWQGMPGRYYVLGSEVLRLAAVSGVAEDHHTTLTDAAGNIMENGLSVQSAAALVSGTLMGSGNPDAETAVAKAEAAVLSNDEQKKLAVELTERVEALDQALDVVKEMADDIGKIASKAGEVSDRTMAERIAAAEAIGRYLAGTE